MLHPDGSVEVGQIISIDQNGLSILVPVNRSGSKPDEAVQLDVLLVDDDIFLENVDSLIISKQILPEDQKQVKYHPPAYCFSLKFTHLTLSQERKLGTITTH